MRPRPINRSRLRWLVIGVTMLAALAVPAAAQGGAQQVVIQVVDEQVPLEFDDPCTGLALHGVAVENGVIRITELGDGGHHVRVDVRGTVDLFDAQETYVGTWSYRLTFRDQYPPDGQGAVQNLAVGPIEYADGRTAIIQGHTHEVFGKGDVLKLEFFKTHCARG